ncbi:Fungal chitosanase [Caballeronia calidae]|uniref:Fungal chitosanase n=2 Tax=Caballeronia calidae TaxID=1777139 RepID=A0A158BA40_9BURK|nr:Fungal chitosanase [Caballeronia calidae]
MLSISRVGLCVVFMVGASVARGETYTAPASSAEVLGRAPLSGVPVANDWKAEIAECGSKGTVGGQLVQGCGRWCDDQLRVNGKANSKCTRAGQLLSKPHPRKNTAILKLRDGTILFDAKLSLDTDGPGTIQGDSTRQLTTSLTYSDSKYRKYDKYLNAGAIPFIVVPPTLRTRAQIEIGDLAAVVSGNRIAYAVVGDSGPAYNLGEGSLKLHQELGHNVCTETDPLTGGCTKVDDVDFPTAVIYLVFPGSFRVLCKDSVPGKLCPALTPDNLAAQIGAKGKEAFERFKGNVLAGH